MTTTDTPILLLSIADQYYALLISDVVEVAAMVELIKLPDAAPEFLGVADRHGAVLPILDLRHIFAQTAAPVTASTLFVVANHESQLVGLVIDDVHQVEYIAREHLQFTSTFGKHIRGIISNRERLILVIALDTLFATYLSGVALDNEFIKG